MTDFQTYYSRLPKPHDCSLPLPDGFLDITSEYCGHCGKTREEPVQPKSEGIISETKEKKDNGTPTSTE